MFLTGEAIGVKIKDRVLFKNVDVAVEQGMSLAIVGPSGSGKTTLLNCLGLIQRLTTGRIVISGHDYTGLSKKEVLGFWKRDASFIYQDSGVIDEESVLYNVTLRRDALRRGSDAGLDEALLSVGLADRKREKAAVLSGGEKQRLGLARAIYKRAAVIYADEPTASLDEKNRALVRDLLFQRTAAGASVIIATHDLNLAQSCDEVLDLGDYQACR